MSQVNEAIADVEAGKVEARVVLPFKGTAARSWHRTSRVLGAWSRPPLHAQQPVFSWCVPARQMSQKRATWLMARGVDYLVGRDHVRLASAVQGCDRFEHRFAQRRQVVAAFEHGSNWTVQRGCEIANLTGHLGERARFEPAVRKRVGAVGIKACRYQDELGREHGRSRHDHVFQHRQPCVVARAGWNRDVDGVAGATTAAHVSQRARPRKQPLLVDRTRTARRRGSEIFSAVPFP